MTDELTHAEAEAHRSAAALEQAERFLKIKDFAALVDLTPNYVYTIVRTQPEKLKFGRVVRLFEGRGGIRIAVPADLAALCSA